MRNELQGTEFIIVADYVICGKVEPCLVCLAGKDRAGAEEKLQRIINNPTDNDKALLKDGKNPRIKEVESKECWWNYGTD